MAKTVLSRLKKINTALPGLLAGIVAFGVLCQTVIFFFVGNVFRGDRANCSIGLWAGVLTAILMAFHMAVTLNSVVERGVKGAQAAATKHVLVRYLVLILVMVILASTGVGSPLAAFAGVMGLKISAFVQPLLAGLYRGGKLKIKNSALEGNPPETNCKTE